ncbi:MAG: hypothetical protein NW226_24760 [Microscillaceae bacterium]|nr:hypothetical protein [Microscillaceae bacterium]
MRYWNILGCFFGLISQLTAQSQHTTPRINTLTQTFETQPIRESIYLHQNTAEICVGETLFFKVYCLNQQNQNLSLFSKIAYVELLDTQQKPALQTKIELRDGLGYGDFFIPSDLKTGAYRLVAYTRWMQNFSIEDFFQSNLLIINPFQSLPDSIADLSNSQISNQNFSLYPIQVALDKTVYQNREAVKLQLSLDQNQNPDLVNLSVSVRKKQPQFHFSTANIQNYLSTKPKNLAPPLNTHLPELRGMLLSGTLRHAQSKAPLSNRLIYLSVPSKNYYFDATRSNAEGRFYFNISRLSTQSELIIQTQNTNQEDIEITLDQDFQIEYPTLAPNQTLLHKIDSAWLATKAVHIQVENAYFEFKKDSVLSSGYSRFYKKPDAIYRLDDYTRFRKMEEVLREIVYTVFLRRKDDRYFVKVSKSRSDLPLDGEAFVLLDGVPVFDINAFLNYDPLKIERLEVIGSRYFKGALDCQGIVSFETYQGDFQGISLPPEAIRRSFIGTQPSKLYFQPLYHSPEAKASRIPDFREQLYWNPEIKLASGDSLHLEFYTSDDFGEYIIDIQGFSAEGKVVSYQATFRVGEGKER